jgi:hypothetical protein
METNKNLQRKPVFPVILTLTGILIGSLLSLLAVWADYEATAYGFARQAQAPFPGLSCPVFIGKDESGVVSVKISNPADQIISPSVRTQVSAPSVFDMKLEHARLAPGEQITLERTVGPENVDLGMFIFVHALVFSAYPIPARENTCGILVLPIPIGSYLWILGTALSTALMATGIFILYKKEQLARPPHVLLFMVIATLLAIFFGFKGWWLPGAILIVILLLTLLITAGRFFTETSRPT